jgi:hypothetical protein
MKKAHVFLFVLLALGAVFLARSALAGNLQLSGALSGVYATENGQVIVQGSCLINSGANAILIGDGITFQSGFQVKTGGGLVTMIADYDGLPDPWEVTYFGNLYSGPNDDPDGDGVTNLQEYQQGTNPAVYAPDSDGDGLPDTWERMYFGNLLQGPNDDPDGDGLSNLQEYTQGSDPRANPSADSDGDGIINSVEELLGTDLYDSTSRPEIGSYFQYDELGRVKQVIRVH